MKKPTRDIDPNGQLFALSQLDQDLALIRDHSHALVAWGHSSGVIDTPIVLAALRIALNAEPPYLEQDNRMGHGEGTEPPAKDGAPDGSGETGAGRAALPVPAKDGDKRLTTENTEATEAKPLDWMLYLAGLFLVGAFILFGLHCLK